MSFLRHEQIYQSDVFAVCAPGLASLGFAPESHRLDESATGYSSARCTPALLASASPGDCHGEGGSRELSTTTRPGLGNFQLAIWGFQLALTQARLNRNLPYGEPALPRPQDPLGPHCCSRPAEHLACARGRLRPAWTRSNSRIHYLAMQANTPARPP
jgi:hypothetical protein